ncbi:Organic cation/carnitine transporter like [Quillaja saponaria]|uniref:Organic cation/carnitine transporter like n=1 Tax=Quillaja saponaria TaxID=32244 RepID=A0AAD7Q5M3_QUISA|nr:Organic cation/carnitine transporter like [Quillaja saponaria]
MMEDEEQKLVQGSLNLDESAALVGKSELTVDEVVEGYVGSLGFSQLLHVFLVSLAWIFDSQSTLVTIFSDAQPPAWRCKADATSWSACISKYSNNKNDGSVCGLVPRTWEWVTGNTSSTIAKWDLICERNFLGPIPASLFFLGSLLRSAVYGRLADSCLGRKRTVFVSCILTSATAFITSLYPNVWFVPSSDLQMGLPDLGLAYAALFYLQKQLAANSVVRGRGKEALEVSDKFARLNGNKLPENIILANPSPTKTSCSSEGQADNTGEDKTLWTTKWDAKRMATVMVAGLGVGFVYYGIQLNVENLSFNLYFTVALNAMMEIPAVFIGSFLLGFTNRRLLFSVSTYIADVSCILCSILSNMRRAKSNSEAHQSRGSWVQLAIEAIGFMGASTAFDVSYIYCVELFPTNVRNFAVSMLRQALMLGASIVPLLVVLGCLSPSISFLIFGA